MQYTTANFLWPLFQDDLNELVHDHLLNHSFTVIIINITHCTYAYVMINYRLKFSRHKYLSMNLSIIYKSHL